MKPLLWVALSIVTLPQRIAAQGAAGVEKQTVSEPSISDLRRDAESGNPEAQYKLGLHYLDASDVSRDDTEGLKWLRKSAEAGHPLSQVTLGLIYREGSHGTAENSAESVKWLRKAAEAGDAHGQSELGFMYERGEGVTKDTAEAVRLYTLAANQNLPVAQFDLAYMYENGYGVPADAGEVVILYEKAAISIPTARTNLAVLFSDGKSVPRDSIRAYMWGLLAVSAEFNRMMSKEPDHPDSRFGHSLLLLEKISKEMSKHAKKPGRIQATEWINSHASQLGKEPHFFPFAISGLK